MENDFLAAFSSLPSPSCCSTSSLSLSLGSRKTEMERVQQILQHLELFSTLPDVNIDCGDQMNRTPLMMCYKYMTEVDPVSLALENEFNIKPSTLLQDMLNIAQLLIWRGANINAQDSEKCSILCYAVRTRNLEAVCMLLYYGVEVLTDCRFGHQSLDHTVCDHICDPNMAIGRQLIYYYDQFPFYAMEPALAGEFIMARLYELDEDKFKRFLCFVDRRLFTEVLRRLPPDWVVKHVEVILIAIVRCYIILSDEWIDNMYFVLGTLETIRMEGYCNYTPAPHMRTFFLRCLCKFSHNAVDSNVRTTIISWSLYLGFAVDIVDICFAHCFFGFREEFTLLLYAANFYRSMENEKFSWPIPTLICYPTQECNAVTLCQNFMNLIHTDRAWEKHEYILYSLSFFALPFDVKQKLKMHYKLKLKKCDLVLKKLDALPEVPLLLELSRNKVHTFIRQNFRVDKYHYQFLDVVKSLKLPQVITDIVCFKTPLYID